MALKIRERIAQNIKKYREKKGFGREALSLALGVDNSYISKLEKGRINITVDKLAHIADILEIDVVELLSK